MDTIVAAIDCGTNSTRLLIAKQTGPTHYETLLRETTITRLGEGVDASQKLSTDAIDRVLVTLIGYAGKIAEYGVSTARLVATSAVRDASNGNIFLSAVEDVTQIEPEVLNGADEAHLSFIGATKDLSEGSGPSLVIDIGGGSTEFAFGNAECETSHSANIGCVRISERFIKSDPPLPEELSAAQSLVDLHLDDVLMNIPNIHKTRTVIGVAGTISSTSMIEQGLHEYDFNSVHGHCLTKESIEEVFRLIVTDDRDGRLSNPGMEEGRVDVIVGGLCVLVQIMRKLSFEQLIVSETDILDGLILSLLQ